MKKAFVPYMELFVRLKVEKFFVGRFYCMLEKLGKSLIICASKVACVTRKKFVKLIKKKSTSPTEMKV